MHDIILQLRRNALEEIESHGAAIIRQANHLNQILSLSDMVPLLTSLESLLATDNRPALARCLAEMRHALGLEPASPLVGTDGEASPTGNSMPGRSTQP
jgi:hypothetical protein